MIDPAKFDQHNNELTFIFDTKEDAEIFKAWMSDGGGEQGFNNCDEEHWFDFDYWNGDKIKVTKEERDW